MNAYADASVLLAPLLGESHPNPIVTADIERVFTSELTTVECVRTFDRLRLTGGYTDAQFDEALARLGEAVATVDIVRLDSLVLRLAAQPFPRVIRTLDALHLSVAVTIRDALPGSPVLFLTHDRQQAAAAIALGFEVAGVGLEPAAT